jgi:hypothetical protein
LSIFLLPSSKDKIKSFNVFIFNYKNEAKLYSIKQNKCANESSRRGWFIDGKTIIIIKKTQNVSFQSSFPYKARMGRQSNRKIAG